MGPRCVSVGFLGDSNIEVCACIIIQKIILKFYLKNIFFDLLVPLLESCSKVLIRIYSVVIFSLKFFI